MSKDKPIVRTPYRPEQKKQFFRELNNTMSFMPCNTPQIENDSISTIIKISNRSNTVFNLQVEGNNNFFAEGILVHNCILDDMVKSAEQAGSKTYRDKAWEWWQSTMYTRLEGINCALVTLTRWHEDDIVGRLLEQAKNDPEADQWEVISFPAIKEDESNPYDPRQIGDALWANRYDIKRLERIKKSVGTKFWNALYQQSPSAMEGNIIKRHWWQFYDLLPDGLEINQSWDLTFDETEKGSFVVGTVWGAKGDNHYLIDLFRERCGFNDQLKMVRTAKNLYPTTRRIFVEKKANGSALINTLQKEIGGIIPCEPHGSKVMRAESQTPCIESGNVYLPRSKPWVPEFIEEHTNFPNGKFDDQVDSTSQYLFNKRNAKTPIKAFVV